MKYRNYTNVEQLVRRIAELKQIPTQYGSSRPYAAGFLFAGWDRNYGYQLYSTDPSGIFNCWKAHALGMNYNNAQSSLKENYEDNMSFEKGLKLAVKVLRKTLDKNTLKGENIDILTLTYDGEEMIQKVFGAKEIDEILSVLDEDEKNEKKTKIEKVLP